MVIDHEDALAREWHRPSDTLVAFEDPETGTGGSVETVALAPA